MVKLYLVLVPVAVVFGYPTKDGADEVRKFALVSHVNTTMPEFRNKLCGIIWIEVLQKLLQTISMILDDSFVADGSLQGTV